MNKNTFKKVCKTIAQDFNDIGTIFAIAKTMPLLL